MRLAPIITFFLAASVAAIKYCKRGYTYCGSTLIQRDPKYRKLIVQSLQLIGRNDTENDILNSRFKCLVRGDIIFLALCQEGCGRLTAKGPDCCLVQRPQMGV